MEHVGDELRPGFGWVSLVSRDESSVLGVVGVSTSTVFVTVDTIVVNAASAGVVVASGAAEEQPDANVTAAIGRTAKRLISSPVIAAFLPSVSAGNPKRTSSPRSGTRRVPHPRASITRRGWQETEITRNVGGSARRSRLPSPPLEPVRRRRPIIAIVGCSV